MILKSYEIQKKLLGFFKCNIFLFYGENQGLKKEIKKSIIEKIKKEDSNVELQTVYESDISENEENFYTSIFSGSLFSKKKIITINNCTDKILNQMESIVEKDLEDTFLILFSDILEKKSKLRSFFEKEKKTICVACYLDNDRDLEIVATKKFRENKIILSRELINLLIEKSNNDRGNLNNEIEKIISYSLNKKNLNIDEIKLLINFSGEHKADNFINECLSGNIIQYKKILNDLYIDSVNHIYILRVLNNKIDKLVKMKELEKNYNDLDSLINSSKPPIFWKEKPTIKKQLTVWSFNELKKVVKEINNTEALCKKNPQISKIIFFNFFSMICKKANNYS